MDHATDHRQDGEGDEGIDRPSTGQAPDDATTASRPVSGSRRAFLAGVGAAGLTALAGCTVSVSESGITWGDGTDTADRGTPTATTTRTATGTTTTTPTRTTTTADPTTTTQEFEVVTLEPETPEYVVGDPVTTTAEPEPVTARFEMHNFRLYVVDADDGTFEGPRTLELYGDIGVRGYRYEGADWLGPDSYPVVGVPKNRVDFVGGGDPENYVQVEQGKWAKRLAMDVEPIYVDFPDFENIDTSEAHVEVRAKFWDSDTGGDDFFGFHSFKFYLNYPVTNGETANAKREAKNRISFRSEDGGHFRLSFDVSRVF